MNSIDWLLTPVAAVICLLAALAVVAGVLFYIYGGH